ncbi:MAG: carbohydrate kinase [Rhizobiales bacterium]|nr:carbohydrate kinase [Hyphomicrobiales bacterium]
MSGSQYCTVGNISIDDLVFPDGTTMWCVPGGNAIYSALGIAIWRERPDVIAPMGPEYPKDVLGDRIDLSHVRLLERNMRNWGLYEEDGTRTFTFRTKTRNWIEFCPTVADVHGSRYLYAHLAPLPWPRQIEISEQLRQNGARVVSVDPDDRYVHELDSGAIIRLLRAVDLFLPSQQDAEAMLPGRTPLDSLRALRDMAPELPVVAVKCGADGVLMHQAGADDFIRLPTAAASVVDATGAGDAFSGGALAGYSKTSSAVEAVLWGSVSASFAVAATGPAALVSAGYEEAQARLGMLRSRIETYRI